MEPMASAHDAWVSMLPHGQSTINTLGDPLVPTWSDLLVTTGQSAGSMLGDPLVPTMGDPLVPTTGDPLVPTMGDPLVPTSGDPLVPTGQSTGPTLGALMLPPCCLAPDLHPPLLLHSSPVAHVNVFVDDFIGLAQGSPSLCQHVRCCILHAVNCVFAPATADTPNRKETVSKKKTLKGDGGWMQCKEILGWMLNSAHGTLELTDCHKALVLSIFDELWGRKRVSLKSWQCILGELHFMEAAIPRSAGLFGALQFGLCHANKHRVCITTHLRDHLTDFELLAQSIATHPTRFAELIPDYPLANGSVDAAKSGMGGVLFADSKQPLLWHMPFPPDIQARTVSTKNPNGDIMNSNLEQAGVLAQAHIMNTVYDLRDQMLATLNNNITAISHNKKGAITSDQSAAYLCCLTSLHRCHHRYYHEVSHISGEANKMTDTLS